MPFHNDRELIEAIRKKDNAAMKYLYKKHTGAIKRFVKQHGGEETEAEDIVQDVIIILFEKIVSGYFTLNPGVRLSTYMVAVGKNLYYKKCREKGKYVVDLENLPPLEDAMDIDSIINTPDQNETIVNQALQALQDICKEILIKFYYEKKSMREIAALLGTISEENVRKHKYRCLGHLRKMITNKIYFHG